MDSTCLGARCWIRPKANRGPGFKEPVTVATKAEKL